MNTATLEETPYTPISVLSVLAFLVGGLSGIAYLLPSAIAICIVGVILAGVALLNIRLAQGELAGRGLARVGLAVSLFCTATATGLHYYQHRREVPRGAHCLSMRDLVPSNGRPQANVDELIGTSVSLRGVLWPSADNGVNPFSLTEHAGSGFGQFPQPDKLVELELGQLPEKPVSSSWGKTVSILGRLERSSIDQRFVIRDAEFRPQSSPFNSDWRL